LKNVLELMNCQVVGLFKKKKGTNFIACTCFR